MGSLECSGYSGVDFGAEVKDRANLILDNRLGINMHPLHQKENPIVEIPDSDLDKEYVKTNVLTNTDLFLENRVGLGELRTWHLIFIISGALMVTSEMKLQSHNKNIFLK